MNPCADNKIAAYIAEAYRRLDVMADAHKLADAQGKAALEGHIGEILAEIKAALALAELIGLLE